MNKTKMISDSLALINELDRVFQADKQGTADQERFQYNLRETARILSNSQELTNDTIMALEKFYRATSFLVGLGDVRLSQASQQAWRAFDRFYYETIRDQLHLYGGSAISQV